MKNILKFNKKYLLGGVLLLVVVLYFIFGRGSSKPSVYVVKKADVTQSVVLSGKVQTRDRADLGFASSGRVQDISVKNNQIVQEGAVLARLEVGDLLADLKIKEANLRTSDVDLDSAKNELDRVKNQEDAKVDSAYNKLLSSDLVLIPEDEQSTLTPPTISGLYSDTTTGQYKINFDQKYLGSSDIQFNVFGLETKNSVLSKTAPSPLGTRGLYVSFASTDNLASYIGTTWFLDIPNKSSSSYVANSNAYTEAKKAHDLAVQEAEFKYKKLLTEGDNGSSAVAQGEIDKIKAEIRKNTIFAPFAGKVTNIEKEVGESASVGERVITILGENKLEVVLQVSELDVSRIPDLSAVDVTLDAFPGETFHGILKTINSRDTTIDGVPVYEAFVELAPDDRIKTGMSANGLIILSTKKDVLVVPSYLITKSAGVSTVEVLLKDEKTEKRNIEVGLTGTDSMVEVLAGLTEGEQIVSTNTK